MLTPGSSSNWPTPLGSFLTNKNSVLSGVEVVEEEVDGEVEEEVEEKRGGTGEDDDDDEEKDDDMFCGDPFDGMEASFELGIGITVPILDIFISLICIFFFFSL